MRKIFLGLGAFILSQSALAQDHYIVCLEDESESFYLSYNTSSIDPTSSVHIRFGNKNLRIANFGIYNKARHSNQTAQGLEMIVATLDPFSDDNSVLLFSLIHPNDFHEEEIERQYQTTLVITRLEGYPASDRPHNTTIETRTMTCRESTRNYTRPEFVGL